MARRRRCSIYFRRCAVAYCRHAFIAATPTPAVAAAAAAPPISPLRFTFLRRRYRRAAAAGYAIDRDITLIMAPAAAPPVCVTSRAAAMIPLRGRVMPQ